MGAGTKAERDAQAEKDAQTARDRQAQAEKDAQAERDRQAQAEKDAQAERDRQAQAEKDAQVERDRNAAGKDRKWPFKVISRLDYDGERYEAGDEVMLTDKVAKDLIGHTVVAKV
jgi:hypothetical protein